MTVDTKSKLEKTRINHGSEADKEFMNDII